MATLLISLMQTPALHLMHLLSTYQNDTLWLLAQTLHDVGRHMESFLNLVAGARYRRCLLYVYKCGFENHRAVCPMDDPKGYSFYCQLRHILHQSLAYIHRRPKIWLRGKFLSSNVSHANLVVAQTIPLGPKHGQIGVDLGIRKLLYNPLMVNMLDICPSIYVARSTAVGILTSIHRSIA